MFSIEEKDRFVIYLHLSAQITSLYAHALQVCLKILLYKETALIARKILHNIKVCCNSNFSPRNMILGLEHEMLSVIANLFK